MEAIAILEILKAGGIGIGVILLTLIKIPKLEINIWGLLAKRIGKAINSEVYKRLDSMDEKVDMVKECLDKRIEITEQYRINECRRAILIFDDELYTGKKHTQERFNDVLDEIDIYQYYCETHPEYPNNKAEAAMRHIRSVYDECLEKHSFL